jgi:monothiol glutaredoxin
MAMPAAEIEALIKAALPDAEVEIEALVDDGDHYRARGRLSRVCGQEPGAAAQARLRGARRAHGRRTARLATRHRRSQLIFTSNPAGSPFMSDTNERLSKIVGENDVVLFMKGTPLFPQCGFSSRAVAILDHCGVAYESVDVLQDMDIRQGIKAFSDWPTIPQLYVKGEFVGGSDIMMEMYQAGELQQLLDEPRSPRRADPG